MSNDHPRRSDATPGTFIIPSIHVRCSGLTLRSASEEDIDRLMEVLDSKFDFSEQLSLADSAVIRRTLTHQLAADRVATSTLEWMLRLVAEDETGALVGWATLAPDPPTSGRRPLASTSWVIEKLRSTGEGHGRGIGTAIRRGVLALAFDGLDADMAVSLIRPGNEASLAVARKLGYSSDGSFRPFNVGGKLGSHDVWTLRRNTWTPTVAPAELSGHDPLREWLDQD